MSYKNLINQDKVMEINISFAKQFTIIKIGRLSLSERRDN